jgi:hypothetical protein
MHSKFAYPGQRLQSFSSNWQSMSASRTVLGLVRSGYKMKFSTAPKLTKPLAKFETRLPHDQMEIVRKEVRGFLEKKAIRIVPQKEAEETLGFYSKLFCVPKPGENKWRMIIDMRKLNKHILKKKFKMQGVKDVRSALQPKMFGAVIDISDAYYHVSINKKARRYTRFIVDGVVYEYMGLPMGLCCSPRIFTRISKFVCDWLRKRGVILIIYIDDILVLGRSYAECLKHVKMVLKLLGKLGFLVNPAKCELDPSTSFTYLGCCWDTDRWQVSLKKKRVDNICKSARNLLSRSLVKAKDVARFLGRTQSAAGIVPLARLRTRTVQHEFSQVVKTPDDYSKLYEMSSLARSQLLHWTELGQDSMPITFAGMLVESLDTDASDFGYGWFWKSDIFSDYLPLEWQDQHINVTELWTLKQFLDTEGSHLKDILLCWRCDNNAAMAAIKK